MAKGTKTGGRDFAPGVSGNPAGRPPAPPDVRAVRTLTQSEIERIANELLEKTRDELKAILDDPRTPAKVAMFARLIKTATYSSDQKRLRFLLDRIVGQVDTKVPVGQGTLTGAGLEASPVAAEAEARELTFEEFCAMAGYPAPYPKQLEMMRFGIEETEPRLLLGAPGYGKTDFVVIAGVAFDIYRNFRACLHTDKLTASTTLLMSKSTERNKALLSEVAEILGKAGVPLAVNNATEIRVEGLAGKEASLSSLTIKAVSLRGRHPKRAIMEDVVTEDDTSESTRALVEKKYSELLKRTQNVLVLGQPVHKFDLYETLRPKLAKKLEVPHGSIPELDTDLEALKRAGVSWESISASYHLKVISQAGFPFEGIQSLPAFLPHSVEAMAFIDPSSVGRDTTALSCFRGHFDGIAVEGHCFKAAWNHCFDELVAILVRNRVKKLCFECNALGDQPVLMLRDALKPHGIGVQGRYSTANKHSRIMAASPYSPKIFLADTSNEAFKTQVRKYEYGAEPDDGPDSLATGMEWMGLIRGKVKA